MLLLTGCMTFVTVVSNYTSCNYRKEYQGSSLRLILTHIEAKKVISCNESKSSKMYNEGSNAKQCVTAFINKS